MIIGCIQDQLRKMFCEIQSTKINKSQASGGELGCWWDFNTSIFQRKNSWLLLYLSDHTQNKHQESDKRRKNNQVYMGLYMGAAGQGNLEWNRPEGSLWQN